MEAIQPSCPLFNFEGMNIFNVKAKIVPAGCGPQIQICPGDFVWRACCRTNDPFVVQFVQHKNATNGDIYGVGKQELFTLWKESSRFWALVAFAAQNAQKYGYGGNTLGWEARYFAGLKLFPIP